MIVGAHQRMGPAEGNGHAKDRLGMGDAGAQAVGRDGDVVDLQHSSKSSIVIPGSPLRGAPETKLNKGGPTS